MKKRSQQQLIFPLRNPMMTMMMTMIMMMASSQVPVAESRLILVGQVPDEILQFILNQQAGDFGGGVWTIREWADYLMGYSDHEWAVYMSERHPEWQPEQWEE